MGTNKKPWNQRWQFEEELPGGGQGLTSLVKSIKGNRKGVLKVLRNKKKMQARVRMYQEVQNLKLLHDSGGNVPRVVDDNVDSYEDSDAPLFFVMEYRVGETLNTLVERSNLVPRKALKLCSDICGTLSIGHRLGIQHRDLKPDNVLVSDEASPKAFLLDYGLSFNEQDPADATQSQEPFINRFLYLPEYTSIGANRRDQRSDVSAAVAILYYMLSAHKPGNLRDENGRKPHRRPGFEISVENPLLKDRINALFDRAFNLPIEDRIQSIDELIANLTSLRRIESADSVDFVSLGQAVGRELRSRDRSTHLKVFAKNSARLLAPLTIPARNIAESLQPYFSLQDSHPEKIGIPFGMDPIARPRQFTLTAKGSKYAWSIFYHIASVKDQCVVLAHSEGRRKSIHIPTHNTPWQELRWYPGESPPTEGDYLVRDLEARMGEGVEWIRRKVLPADGSAISLIASQPPRGPRAHPDEHDLDPPPGTSWSLTASFKCVTSFPSTQWRLGLQVLFENDKWLSLEFLSGNHEGHPVRFFVPNGPENGKVAETSTDGELFERGGAYWFQLALKNGELLAEVGSRRANEPFFVKGFPWPALQTKEVVLRAWVEDGEASLEVTDWAFTLPT